MITDSKNFKLHAMGRPAGRWCTPATRAFVARPKQSIAAHVYIGIAYQGFTSLKFVTGTHKQVSKYIDPKSKRPYKGLAQQEYTDLLRDQFIPEGNKLFQMLASGLTGGTCNKAMPLLTKRLPTWLILLPICQEATFWPGHQTHLICSPTEKLWSWMDSKLHKLTNVRTLKS